MRSYAKKPNKATSCQLRKRRGRDSCGYYRHDSIYCLLSGDICQKIIGGEGGRGKKKLVLKIPLKHMYYVKKCRR